MSYAIPTAAGERRIQASSGAGAGFAARVAVVPPGAPVIAGVVSRLDEPTGGLGVSWSAVGGKQRV